PGLGPQRAQHRGRMQGPCPNLDVVRLQDHAALRAPIVVQLQDQALKRERLVGHGIGRLLELVRRRKKSRRTIGPADLRFNPPDPLQRIEASRVARALRLLGGWLAWASCPWPPYACRRETSARRTWRGSP